MESLWRKQVGEIKINHDLKAETNAEERRDVIVVGAGMAGILAAYYLQKKGKNVLVLEADKVASGQTERTTAKITSQHGLKYSELIGKIGIQKAGLYARANEEAIREYERLIREEKIDCQFEKAPAYLYTLENGVLLKQEAQAASRLGIAAYFTRETELPFAVKGAVCFRNQARFDPLKFIRHICADLEIWEHTQVVAVRGNRVITNEGELKADKIVIATHYPILNVPGFYFLRQHQERSYVLALSGCKPISGMYLGIDKDGYSLRQAGDYLLFGGGACRTGKNKKGGAFVRLEKRRSNFFRRREWNYAGRHRTACPMTGFRLSGNILYLRPTSMWQRAFRSGV